MLIYALYSPSLRLIQSGFTPHTVRVCHSGLNALGLLLLEVLLPHWRFRPSRRGPSLLSPQFSSISFFIFSLESTLTFTHSLTGRGHKPNLPSYSPPESRPPLPTSRPPPPRDGRLYPYLLPQRGTMCDGEEVSDWRRERGLRGEERRKEKLECE